MTSWVLPSYYTCPGWRADWTRVGIRECHSKLSQALDVGSLVKRGLTVQGGIGPT